MWVSILSFIFLLWFSGSISLVSQYLWLYMRSVPRRLREWKHAVCLSESFDLMFCFVFCSILCSVCCFSSHIHTHTHTLSFSLPLSTFTELNGNLNISGVKSGSAKVCVLFETRELSLALRYDLKHLSNSL